MEHDGIAGASLPTNSVPIIPHRFAEINRKIAAITFFGNAMRIYETLKWAEVPPFSQ
jgi:hypothetical protein